MNAKIEARGTAVHVEVTDPAPWYGAGTYGVLITPRLVEETR